MARYHEIDRLEAELLSTPNSLALRERLLFAYAEDDRTLTDPRRIAHLRWFIQQHPGHPVCTTPLAQPNPQRQPEAYAAAVAEWRRALETRPLDHTVARAAAGLIAMSDPAAGRALLLRAAEATPDDSELWLDLGRLADQPIERLTAFQKARALGSEAPNLLVWIAHSAAQAGELDTADAACAELESLVTEARALHGSALDWPESGRALWARARERTGDDEAALQLTQAIADFAYRTHRLHTVRGLMALALGDPEAAVRHLHASAAVTPDYRLRAYGPSLELARQLCDIGRWSEVVGFLHEWERRWDDPRVRTWLAQAQRGEQPGEP